MLVDCPENYFPVFLKKDAYKLLVKVVISTKKDDFNSAIIHFFDELRNLVPPDSICNIDAVLDSYVEFLLK